VCALISIGVIDFDAVLPSIVKTTELITFAIEAVL
jgi:hypothetical protein